MVNVVLWPTSLCGRAVTFVTALTIATSLVHSKLDSCNSIFPTLNGSQLYCLQLILNTTARAVTRTPKLSRIYLVFTTLHWL
jgi:hypothetical protein